MEININNNPNVGNNDPNSTNSPKSTKSRWIWLVLLLVLAAALWLFYAFISNNGDSKTAEVNQNQPVDKQVSTKEQQKSALARHNTHNFSALNIIKSEAAPELPESLRFFNITPSAEIIFYKIDSENGQTGYKFEYTSELSIENTYLVLQKVSNFPVTGYNLITAGRTDDLAIMDFASKDWKVSVNLEKVGDASTLVKVIGLQ